MTGGGQEFAAPSPFLAHLGARMTGWEEGRALVELPLTPVLMNRQGLPHGGVHAALLDSVMGFAGCYSPPGAPQRLALTLSLTVNFLAQAKTGPLIAEGRVTGGGRRSYFAEGRVTDAGGRPVASATGVFRRRDP